MKGTPTGEAALRARVFSGSLLSMGATISIHVVKFAINLALTRLLYREAFGLMALVAVFLLGLELFSDLGIRASIIHSANGERRRFLDTAYTIQVARGFFLYSLVWLFALPFSEFYNEPQLRELLPVAGLSAIFSGFLSTKFYEANRRLEMKRIMAIQVIAQLASSLSIICFALVSPSVWAIVLGMLVHPFVRTLLSHRMLEGERNRLDFERESPSELFRFGRWIFASTLLTFIVHYSDRLILGRLMPIELLGVFSLALLVTRAPLELLTQVSNQVAFPLYSRAAQTSNFARTFEETRQPLLRLGLFLFTLLMGLGPELAGLIFPAGYEDAGWMIQILGLNGVLILYEAYYRAANLAAGRAFILVVSALAKLIGMAALIPLGFRSFGIFGAILGYALSEILPYLVSAIDSRLRGIGDIRHDGTLIAASLLVAFAARQLAKALEVRGVLLTISLTASFIALLFIPALGPYARALLRRFKPKAEAI